MLAMYLSNFSCVLLPHLLLYLLVHCLKHNQLVSMFLLSCAAGIACLIVQSGHLCLFALKLLPQQLQLIQVQLPVHHYRTHIVCFWDCRVTPTCAVWHEGQVDT